MKRRTLNSKGPGFSKAFQAAAEQARREAARQVPVPSWNPFLETEADYRVRHEAYIVAVEKAMEAAAPVCDQSGDVGSRHIWPDGATVGDWCLCGKRRKFLP